MRNPWNRVWLCIFLTAIVWEIVFIFGISDRFFLSAPSEIIRVFADLAYLRRIGLFSLLLIVLTLLGLTLGVTVGTITVRSRRLTDAFVSFERTAIWMPFLLLWALPIWPVQPHRLIITFGPIFSMTVLAVSMYVSLVYLVARTFANETGSELRSRLVQDGLRQALFFYLIAQIIGRPSYGWTWFTFTPLHGAAKGFASIIVLLVLHYLINRVRSPDFDRDARIRRALAFECAGSSTRGGLFFWLTLILVWYLLSATGLAWLLGSPLNSTREAYALLSGSITFPTSDTTIWDHLAFSMFELVTGMLLGLAISTFLANLHSASEMFKKVITLSICRGAGPTIILPVFFYYWLPQFSVPWATVIMIISVSLYPMIHALNDFADRSYAHRFLVAIYLALPYAFVGLFAGETLVGTKGIGFLTVLISQATKSVDTSITLCLLSMLVLCLFSWTLRMVLLAQHELIQPKE